MSLDASAAWAGILVAALAMVGGGWAVLRVFIRHEMAEIRADTREMKVHTRELVDNTSELKTNGGSHVADVINRIECKTVETHALVETFGRDLAELRGAFTEHIRRGD